jgi:hypothetical protein
LVADFLYGGDFSGPKVVFCGGSFVWVGNTDVQINNQELLIVGRLPGLGVSSASKFYRQNNICMGAALGSQYGALTVAAEILIAQLHSQSKLTMD